MIDLDALDNDPWSTIPVKKKDLRMLANALESMERDLKVVMMDAKVFHAALSMIASQNEEPASREAARRVLGLKTEKQTGLII